MPPLDSNESSDVPQCNIPSVEGEQGTGGGNGKGQSVSMRVLGQGTERIDACSRAFSSERM